MKKQSTVRAPIDIAKRQSMRHIASAAALIPLAGTGLLEHAAFAADSKAALQPIRFGIQIFTGAVATVWYEKRVFEREG